MLNKFKNALYNAVAGGINDSVPVLKDTEHKEDTKTLSHKFPYTRPHFLQLNVEEEIQVSADKTIRPIIVPRDISKLPWNTGYAEAVNAGKSVRNEDQACLRRAVLQHPESREPLPLRGGGFATSDQNNPALSLPYVYFAVFDGHAGAGAALAAANQLHHIVHEKLVDIIDHLLPPLDGIPSHNMDSNKRGVAMWFADKEVSNEALIVGALECAFWEMDNLIAGDRKKYNIKGGCTALVALFILGKVYVANAGDSRAVMVKNQMATALSNDFTPESERGRVRRLAALQPHLLGGEFTHLDFKRRLLAKDLGKRVLYRDAHMMGWAYKTVTQEDLKIPVVHGEGKRSRVLATIGVTRGFGDHDLKALNCNIPIKPFLLSQPEVHILDVSNDDFILSDTDVLLMGTDGLWDMTSNERAAEILQKSFDVFPSTDPQRLKYRFTSAAQDLVMQSRGKLHERSWRTADGKQASTDDISVFVIPLAPYKEEYVAWKHDYDGIRGMYDNDKDSIESFGKLSFRMSPVTSDKLSPSSNSEASGLCHGEISHLGKKNESSQSESSSVIISGWEEKAADTKTLQKKDLECQVQPSVVLEQGSTSKSLKITPLSEKRGNSGNKDSTVRADNVRMKLTIPGMDSIPVGPIHMDNKPQQKLNVDHEVVSVLTLLAAEKSVTLNTVQDDMPQPIQPTVGGVLNLHTNNLATTRTLPSENIVECAIEALPMNQSGEVVPATLTQVLSDLSIEDTNGNNNVHDANNHSSVESGEVETEVNPKLISEDAGGLSSTTPCDIPVNTTTDPPSQP